jgi:hypothetical protein
VNRALLTGANFAIFAGAMMLTRCAALPAVVTDVANIAAEVIADVEKGWSAEQVIADVEAQYGSATLGVIVNVVTALLGDPSVNSADVPGLQSVQQAAQARAAATGAVR